MKWNYTQWEYTVLEQFMWSRNGREETLDEYGYKGWELVSVSEGIFYLKRPLGKNGER